jgi:hypothetical protein
MSDGFRYLTVPVVHSIWVSGLKRNQKSSQPGEKFVKYRVVAQKIASYKPHKTSAKPWKPPH